MAYVDLATPPLGIQLALLMTGIAMLSIIGRRSVDEMITATGEFMVGRPV